MRRIGIGVAMQPDLRVAGKMRGALASASNNSAATMMCFGFTTLMPCASAGPVRWVLSSATTPPMRVTPIQTARNSRRPGIIRQTVSPFAALRQRPARGGSRARGELRDS
jgi:hypothetical protein